MTALPAAVLVLLLLVAAWGDIRRRIIPNRLNLAIAAAAPLWWWAQGLGPWPDVPIQLAGAAAMFALFVGLFALGMIGGGDVKLIGALGLWLPVRQMLDALLLTALAGGAVTVATLIVHRIGRRGGQPEVPYGVAIAAAGIFLVGERYLYQFR